MRKCYLYSLIPHTGCSFQNSWPSNSTSIFKRRKWIFSCQVWWDRILGTTHFQLNFFVILSADGLDVSGTVLISSIALWFSLLMMVFYKDILYFNPHSLKSFVVSKYLPHIWKLKLVVDMIFSILHVCISIIG